MTEAGCFGYKRKRTYNPVVLYGVLLYLYMLYIGTTGKYQLGIFRRGLTAAHILAVPAILIGNWIIRILLVIVAPSLIAYI